MRLFKKIDFLNKSIDKLNYNLEENNLYSIVELLENKKKMLVRNLISGISRGIRNRNRLLFNYCSSNIFFAVYRKIKYSNYWRLYF